VTPHHTGVPHHTHHTEVPHHTGVPHHNEVDPGEADYGNISQIWGFLQPPAKDLTTWELLQLTEGAIPFEETPLYGNFTIFIDLLQTTGVYRILEEQGPYTVFAPTDDVAFASLPPDDLNALTTGNGTGTINRTAVALNHIVKGAYNVSDLQNETTLVTLAGNNLTVHATGGEVRVDNATIAIPDLVAKNGVIQAINRVLIPNDAGGAANLS
jgi:uncharacterized surface protein with fasciclin (FAS1) repeats